MNFLRRCPTYKKELSYSTIGNLKRANEKNVTCRKCSASTQSKNEKRNEKISKARKNY